MIRKIIPFILIVSTLFSCNPISEVDQFNYSDSKIRKHRANVTEELQQIEDILMVLKLISFIQPKKMISM